MEDFHQRNWFHVLPFVKVLLCGGFDGLSLLKLPTKLQKQTDLDHTNKNIDLKLLEGWNSKRNKLIWPSGLWRTGHHILAGSHLAANIRLSSWKDPAVPLCWIEKYRFLSLVFFFSFVISKNPPRQKDPPAVEWLRDEHISMLSAPAFICSCERLKTTNEKSC